MWYFQGCDGGAEVRVVETGDMVRGDKMNGCHI